MLQISLETEVLIKKVSVYKGFRGGENPPTPVLTHLCLPQFCFEAPVDISSCIKKHNIMKGSIKILITTLVVGLIVLIRDVIIPNWEVSVQLAVVTIIVVYAFFVLGTLQECREENPHWAAYFNPFVLLTLLIRWIIKVSDEHLSEDLN